MRDQVRGRDCLDYGRGASFNFANNKFEAKKLTMAVLASTLERFLDRPVLDMTVRTVHTICRSTWLRRITA